MRSFCSGTALFLRVLAGGSKGTWALPNSRRRLLDVLTSIRSARLGWSTGGRTFRLSPGTAVHEHQPVEGATVDFQNKYWAHLFN